MRGFARIRKPSSAAGSHSAGRPAALINPAFGNATITALQAFNLGLAQTYQQGFGNPVVSATYPLYAVFAQDTWKPLSNLTLNYGVRYEVDTRKSPLPPIRTTSPSL